MQLISAFLFCLVLANANRLYVGPHLLERAAVTGDNGWEHAAPSVTDGYADDNVDWANEVACLEPRCLIVTMQAPASWNEVAIYQNGLISNTSAMEIAVGNGTDSMSTIWSTTNGRAFSTSADGTTWVTLVQFPGQLMVAKVVRYCLEASASSPVWPTEIAATRNATLLEAPQEPAPNITSVAPIAGPPGTEVVVTGANFRQGATVTVGDTPCASVAWISDSEMRCLTALIEKPGPVDVRIVNPDRAEAILPHAFLSQHYCWRSHDPVIHGAVVGSDLVIDVSGVSSALPVVTFGDPAHAPESCRFGLDYLRVTGSACSEHQVITMPIRKLAACSQVAMHTEDDGDRTVMTIPWQIPSFIVTAIDPDDPNHYYTSNAYTTYRVMLSTTVRARASTAASGQHAAYILEWEVGASYFDIAGGVFVVQVLGVVNRVYSIFHAEIAPPAGGPDVSAVVVRDATIDNCPEGDTTHRCALGFTARTGAVNNCPASGNYTLGFDVRCVSASSCPEGTEGWYNTTLIVSNERCKAEIIERDAGATLRTVRPSDGAPLGAFRWDQYVTLLMELTPATMLASQLADLRVCKSPEVAGLCQTADSLQLVSAGALTRNGVLLDSHYTPGAALHTVTLCLNSSIFQSQLGFGGNLNVNSSIQFDGVADGLEFAVLATTNAADKAAGANSAALASAAIEVSWPATTLDGGGASMAAVIGGACGGAAVLVAAALLVFALWWKRGHGRRSSPRSTADTEMYSVPPLGDAARSGP